MKLFYSDRFSEPQGGSPYLAILAFVVLYCGFTVGIGLLISGSVGHAIFSDCWVGAFLGILPTSARYKIRIGRLRALLLVVHAIAFLNYAKVIAGLLLPLPPSEQLQMLELAAATSLEVLTGLICVKLVAQLLWKGFGGNLF